MSRRNYFVCFIAQWAVHVFLIPCSAQFHFDDVYDFELTSDATFPKPGDDVILNCRRTERYQNKLSNRLNIAGDNGIAFELNDQYLLTSSTNKRGECAVTRDAGSGFLGAPGFGTHSTNVHFPNITCKDDGDVITLTIKHWTPQLLAGDNWRCLQFPFAESAKFMLQSFVSVRQVRIKQVIDRPRKQGPSDGTIVTCRSTPCRPAASIDWFVQSATGGMFQLTEPRTLREQVDTGRNKLSVTTSAILFTSDDDHGKMVYCAASNVVGGAEPVVSQNISVQVKYPPSVYVQAEPSASIIEGSDVKLRCRTSGRPEPKTSWVKEGAVSGESVLVSLSWTFDLRSVTLSDSGTYTCRATNGFAPNGTASIVLFVREAPVQQDVPRGIPTAANTLQTTGGSNGTSAGGVIGGIVAVLVVIALVALVVFIIYRHRRRKANIFDGYGGQGEESEGQGIYATCSTLPRSSTHVPPPYVEILPTTNKNNKLLASVTNPSYGTGDSIITGTEGKTIKKKRPLPNTPEETDDVHDTGYAYIDESQVSQHYYTEAGANTYLTLERVGTILDEEGYELPVSPTEKSTTASSFDSALRDMPQPLRAQTVHATNNTSQGKHVLGRSRSQGDNRINGRHANSSH